MTETVGTETKTAGVAARRGERSRRDGLAGRLAVRLGLAGEHGDDRLQAASAFSVRVGGAAVTYLCQVLLARWLGSHDFGLYVYAWTLVIVASDLVPAGFGFAAQRVIPNLRHAGDIDGLRGFLVSAVGYALTTGFAIAAAAIALVDAFPETFRAQGPLVLIMAATTLPPHGLANVLDGIARTFGMTNVALVPGFILRPLVIVAFVGGLHLAGCASDAVAAAAAASAATWLLVLGQTVVMMRRIRRVVPAGRADFSGFSGWLTISTRMLMSWTCVTLFTYSDMLVLNHFAAPNQVAIYYATVKTLALTSFVTFAIAAVVGHRFVALSVAGDRAALDRMAAFAVRWTFWPSLAITLAMLVVGKPVLALFGKDFAVGYELLFILSAGMLARASVGPAERVLNMLGHEKTCAAVYVGAFLANFLFCLALVPTFGLYGAAIGASLGMFVEAGALALAAWRRVGLRLFVWPGAFGR